MPGKLHLVTQKLRSESFPQLDVKKVDAGQVYQPVELHIEESSNMAADTAEPKSKWFKTWPERGYDKLDQSNDSSPTEEERGAPSVTSIPLDKILDNIPLAYSPLTKKLHILSCSEQRKGVGSVEHAELLDQVNSEDECDRSRCSPCDAAGDNPKAKLGDEMMLDLSHNLGKDLVLQSCLKRLNEDKYSECRTEAGVWNSKIGYSEDSAHRTDRTDSATSRSELCCSGVLKTEASSFSSIVSSLSDGSPSNLDETASGRVSFVESDDVSVRSHCSHDSSLGCGENSKLFEENAIGRRKTETKRGGLSGFLARNVFPWKAHGSNTPPPNSSPGWKLFGRPSPPTDSSEPSSMSSISTELSSAGLRGSQLSMTESPVSGKKYEDVVASSSALILHKRPGNLPAKSEDEDQKHRLEYQQMVDAARKKELKETKQKKKQLQQQLKTEELLTNATRVWNKEILPKWELMKGSRKARELWWQGLPPCVRGKVWRLAIGNELNITHQLYDICVTRAQERLKYVESQVSSACEDSGDACEELNDDVDKEASVELIQLDISRTFPHLCIFQQGGPYYDMLHCLLGAYVCYRPDVGYVQGMSFIAAILILNLEAPDAFICFANLLNRPCHMAFFSLNQPLMQAYYETYAAFLSENLPRLAQHLTEASLTPDLYLLDWVYTLFAKAMPLDVACRVWDVFLRDGEEFLFRAALGVLHLHQDTLMKLDFIHGAQFLTKLPEDLSADSLFKSIDAIRMNVGKQKFAQVLAVHVDRCSSR